MERFYQRHLPHFRIDAPGVVYFVTWRLARTQRPLEAQERDLVTTVLHHWDGRKCEVSAFVVMDDHVHALVSLLGSMVLENLLHSWKGYTAHRLIRDFHREGQVWQHESYDRVMRSEKEFVQFLEYIVGNPRKRWPDCLAYRWVWTIGDAPRSESPGEDIASPYT